MNDKTWLTIEVLFKHGTEIKRYALKNCTWDKVKKFREVVFTDGFMYPDINDVGRWYIINPWNVSSIEVHKQSHFFTE